MHKNLLCHIYGIVLKKENQSSEWIDISLDRYIQIIF